MTLGTIRLKSDDGSTRDAADVQVVIGEMGYQTQLSPNETRVLADNAGNRTLAANATVTLGTTTQQTVAAGINLDTDSGEQPQT